VNEYGFAERLAFSKSITSITPTEIVMDMLPGCVSISGTDLALDKRGVDYVATLRRGAEVLVDMKARKMGCSRFWRSGPELALETWSVVPGVRQAGKVGWTLDEGKITDYTLHVFDPSDTTLAYLLPFQLLRVAFRLRFRDWYSAYKHATQNSGRWQSECIFVPADVVLSEVEGVMRYGA